MIGALAAVPVAGVPALASAGAINPDPIFALIEAAKRATARSEAANFEDDELNDLQWVAELTALQTRPCSAAGAAALLLYVAESIIAWEPNPGDILPGIVNAARAIAVLPAVSNRLQDALDGNNDWFCASEIPASTAEA